MARNKSARRKQGTVKDKQGIADGGAGWPGAISTRTFWVLALIPLLVFGVMAGRGVARPFEGLHAWAQADSAWFSRNHVRYGLGYTKGTMTMALGYPPPENPKRYYDHPQYGGLIGGSPMWIFGANEWSVRLGFLIMDLAALLLLMVILRRFIGPWPGLLAGLVLAMMPVSAYFGLGAYLTVMGLGAFWMYLVIAGMIPDRQARWWHYAALGSLLFACVQMGWSGFFCAAAIGIHYVVTCIVRRKWPQWGLVAVMVLAPLASATMVFTIMLSGFDWDYHRIIDLYKWRAAKGEMTGQMQGGFDWGAWFGRVWEFGLTNFTLPVLLAAGGYLVYLACAYVRRLIRRLSGQAYGLVAHPFPLGLLLVLPGLLQMFILRGALWPHQFWERPLGPFIAVAAVLGMLALGRLIGEGRRAVMGAVVAGLVALCAWACVDGANYYYSIVWQTPEKIAMWKDLNRLIPPDKELATFDRELDSLVVTQSAAKGAVYRGEPAWYIDRVIVDANTPRQVEALAQAGKAPVYLLPYPGSLGPQVYEDHVKVTEHLVKRYPLIGQYQGVNSQGGTLPLWLQLCHTMGLLPEKFGKTLKFGMRPYAIFDLTRPGQPNVRTSGNQPDQ